MAHFFAHKKHKTLWKGGTFGIRLIIYAGLVIGPAIYAVGVQDPRNMPKLYLLYGSVLAMVFLAVLLVLFLPTLRLRKTIFDIPLLLLALSALGSPLIARSAHIALWGRPDFFVLHALAVVSWVLWIWFALQTLHDFNAWKAALISLLGGGLLALLAFLLISAPIPWPRVRFDNTIGGQYSNLSVFSATLLVLSLGILGISRGWIRRGFAALTGMLSIAVLLKLGFHVGWTVGSIGLFLLLVFAIVRWQKDNMPYFIVLFAAFALSFVFAIIQSPRSLQRELPAEVALSRSASWEIGKATLLHRGAFFFLGSGLGTFSYDFALFRNPTFNVTNIVEGVQFYAPYNSVLALLPEIGTLGMLLTIIIILLAVGTVPLLLSNRLQPLTTTRGVNLLETDLENFRWEMATIYAAWIALTAGIFTAYFEAALWWLWWALLMLLLTGFSLLSIKRLSKELVVSVSLKHPYSLVKSFGLVIVLLSLVGLSAVLTRFYLASARYTSAQNLKAFAEQEKLLSQALSFRGKFTPYRIALSQLYLERAADMSKTEPTPTDEVVSALGTAIRLGKEAADFDSDNFAAWQNAGTIYLNAAPIVDGALTWAQQSFEKARDLAPTHALIYWQLGNTLTQAKDLDDAEKNYRTAIELKPDFLAAYMSLAGLLERQNQLDAALAVYRDIDPSGQRNADILFDYGRLFYNRGAPGDIQNAEVAWREAVTINPNFSNALFSLGALYEREGERGKALEFYQRVAELNPDNQEIQAKIKSLIRSKR